jgi:RNA polymerase-binding transcription factor
MPSKKSNKALKKPAKATPKKAARKVAIAKKAARLSPGAKPTIPSKVIVRPHKPVPKAAKPAASQTNHIAHPMRAKPQAPAPHIEPRPSGLAQSAETLAPIKFDSRPLVMPTRVAPPSDDDADGDSSGSGSLLAGPRNVKPYIARRGEQYMNKEQLEHFSRILQSWKRDLMVEVDRTVLHMKDEAANFPDPNDRATQEEEFSLELRTRDRERKLIRKIDEALKRIEDGSYGYCLETGEEIGIKRLEARPVATLSVEAQERRERREKQYGDRDDRYR